MVKYLLQFWKKGASDLFFHSAHESILFVLLPSVLFVFCFLRIGDFFFLSLKVENSFKVHALPFTLLYLLDHNAASLKHNICSTNPVG